MFINATPKWSSFSASVEAIYFYTPVIVTLYKDFMQTFGEHIDFGCYCEENSAALLEEKMLAMLQHPAYQTLCVNAHKAVKEFIWDSFTDKIIRQIEAVMP